MNTRTKITSLCLAISSTVLFSQNARAVATADGDLLIGFYQVISGSVQSKTYIFDLGKASLYRENSQSNVLVSAINPAAIASSNIGADLATIFGSDWAESGTVYWAVFGGAETGSPLVFADGDCSATSYVSVPAAAFVQGQSTTPLSISGTPRGTLANSIAAIRSNSNGLGSLPVVAEGPPVEYLSGANPRGAQIATGSGPLLGATVDYFFPPTSSLYLGVAGEKRGLFGAGTLTNSATIEGALDVYRHVNSVNTASGMDLTSGLGTGNATLGTGQYIGTFTIDTSGVLKVYGTPPSTPGYYSFASANGLTGGPNADSDNDGINNLTEYALNTNLNGSDGSVGTLSAAGVLSFTKRAAAVANGDLTYSIEVSTDLGVTNPWAPLAGTTNNSTTIFGTLPPGLPKQFGRLKILSSSTP